MDNKRIAKWDNIKFFMIFCVVAGHTLYQFLWSGDMAKTLYLFIYCFHMPVFIFVAGLLSKNAVKEKRVETVVQYLLIYLVMKFLETIPTYILQHKIKFHFFWEDGPAWFGLAMACFMALTMVIQDYDRRYMLLFALVLGCMAGLDNHLGDHFVSMRICVFYPVFLAGFYTDPEKLRLKDKPLILKILLKLGSCLILAALLLIIAVQISKLYPFLKLLKGKYPYENMGFGITGILIRLFCYLFWILIVFAVVILVSDRKHIASWIGRRTMSVFIWHNFIIEMVFKVFPGKKLLVKVFPHYYLAAAVILAMMITILCAYLPEIRLKKRPAPTKGKAVKQMALAMFLINILFLSQGAGVHAAVLSRDQESGLIWFGDSRTVFFAETVYGYKPEKGVRPQRIINKHIVARRSSMYQWANGRGYKELSKRLQKKPDSIIIFNFGVNDIGRGYNHRKQYRNLIRKIHNRYPGAVLCFMSVNPVKGSRRNPYARTGVKARQVNQKINSFNAYMQKNLPSGCLYIDTNNNIPFTFIDGLHYKKDTYRRIAYYITGKKRLSQK